MEKHEKFMKEAIKEAKIALKHSDWPVGAVIVLEDKIIARGHNHVYSKENKLAHAEMIVLNKAQKTLIENKGKCTLYTTCETMSDVFWSDHYEPSPEAGFWYKGKFRLHASSPAFAAGSKTGSF